MQNAVMISPSATIDVIDSVEKAIWAKYSSYKNIMRYVRRWHHGDDWTNENFYIQKKQNSDEIDLLATLDGMSDELLFQIAVDLNVTVPGLIYSIAEIKGVFADKYEDAVRTFQKAHERIYADPSTAIIMANSALELIIKKICAEEPIEKCNSKDTLYKLAEHILKQFNFFPDKHLDSNIRNIGSSLLKLAQAIENIRSNHTEAHGTEDEIISDPLYAMLIVNAVATTGLFLLNYYEKNFKLIPTSDEDPPF